MVEKIHGLTYSNGKLAFGYDNINVAILEIKTGEVTRLAVNLDKRFPIYPDLRRDYIAIRSEYEAVVMNWKTGKTVFSIQDTEFDDAVNVLFANDDTVIISGNSTVLVYNIATDSYFDQFHSLTEEIDVVVLESGKSFLCADWEGNIHFFNLTSSEPIRQYSVDEQIFDVAVAERHNALYTWHGTHACKWDIDTGELFLIFKREGVNLNEEDQLEFRSGILTYNRDRLISVGDSASIYLWDTSTGQLMKTLSGHPDRISGLVLGEGNTLYSCGRDVKIRRWNLDTFESEEVDISGLD